MWPPVPGQFPPKREIEDCLLYSGKKKGPYVRRENLSRVLCLLHMIAHRNILPQLGNKNVLVGNMLYLVYLYRQGNVLDLPNIIMHEMLLTANLNHHTQALPFGRFISQLLTDLGYIILEGEEVDCRDEILNFQYWEKSRKHMVAETDSELEDSETEAVPAGTVSVVAPVASTGAIPHDIASLYAYIDTQFRRLQSFVDALSSTVHGSSSGGPAPGPDLQP
ncbi:hypothetical protein GIB67_018655 [Kingdonia uniflora]|uniref:Uncharacterized protein n=1 Tax=Kingdonia uniflora TaxID=39325 RepID=A0A7J7M2J7_9MAGN|nr:hypothetical protein GIB67_018655 [Kingdonia uniflora]